MNCIKPMRLGSIALAFLLFATLGTSCKFMKAVMDEDSGSGDDDVEATDDGKPHSVITVNEIVKYPRAADNEVNAPSFDGTTICLNKNYYINSKNITKVDMIEMKDKPGFYNLDLTLDKAGRVPWAGMSVRFRDSKLAFVIDGVFYREFTPEQLESDTDTVVRIKGPFDKATAAALKANAEQNYKLLNEKKKSKD